MTGRRKGGPASGGEREGAPASGTPRTASGTPIDPQAAEHVARVEAVLDAVENLPDPAAREVALEAVQALLELYGAGLARVVGSVGEDAVQALAGDELVAHLLMLHGLHPVAVEERVSRALEEVRPYLESHGGGVELLGVEDGVARLRMEGTCDGCPSSSVTLKFAVEEAVHRAAPEVERVEAEGEEAPAPAVLPILQIESRLGGAPANGGLDDGGPGGGSVGGRAPAGGSGSPATSGQFWGVLEELDLPDGATTTDEVLGRQVLFANLGGTLFAYRPSCPSCAASLEGAVLAGDELTCGGCGRRYDARRAGRCLEDAPAPGLEPLPLLAAEAGGVKVAVATVGS
jgi:Fe-S cluster biogenesis protein NfuA/nitrite reductase/ring-hydroxylating ferredoxin subunit